MARDIFAAIMGDGGDGGSLTSEQEDAIALWSEPPYWNFLTGVWPLRGTKSKPSVPIYWTLDTDLNKPRPMPSVGYEYARDAILEPIFCWRPKDNADRLEVYVNKSRKVLGTLWVLTAAGAEILFRDAVSWKLVKGKHEEAQALIIERLRFAYAHENFPEFLRRARPVRPKPLGKFARHKPGAPSGVFMSMLAAVGQNFGQKEAKGGTNDFIIDEAVELVKSLSTDESPAFVNGLLARIAEVKHTLG